RALVAGTTRKLASVVVPTVTPPQDRAAVTIGSPTEGRSNTLPIDVDPSCTSGPITPEDERASFKLGENLLVFKPSCLSSVERNAFKRENGYASLQSWGLGGDLELFVIGRLQNKTALNTVNTAQRVRQNKCIAFADLNYLQDALQQLPSDPEVAKQDHILKLNILQGWETFFPSRGSGAILGVVDSGIDLNYVQTAPEKVEQANDTSYPYGISIAPGAEDELRKGKIPYAADEFGHGTEVGTIAAAKADNGVAGVGVAPNVAVINMKVFSLKGRTTEAHVAISMFIMTLLQADVVNMSIGCLGCFRAVKRKQGEFYEKMLDGLEKMLFKERIIKIPIFVAAAGNDGLDIVDAPARNATACNGPKQRVIAVGSYSFTTKTRSQDFSNYGPELCFVAPGDDVQTLHLGGEFKGTGPGTSFSTPQVAGLVALILSMEPELVNGGATAVIEKIKKCFVQDVDPPGYDEETGWGLIRIPSPEQVDPKQCPYFRK
ncbi:S8/S53 family peptidase, partial [Candidatus Acetothermia bacterium]|nr:S8/S53 family peptidase [Candidatus Acetothermia bacterium]